MIQYMKKMAFISNGSDWSDLAATVASSGRFLYTYTDEEPFASGPRYYRLRLHSDGLADNWSKVQVLPAKLVRAMRTMYPNPFHNKSNISAAGAFTHLILTSIKGETLWVKDYPGGSNFQNIDGKNYKNYKLIRN